MYFNMKSYLKSTRNYTVKQALNTLHGDRLKSWLRLAMKSMQIDHPIKILAIVQLLYDATTFNES
jgi:hypothetical protein